MSINGSNLHYFDTETRGIPFLLLHGMNGHARYVVPLADYVSPYFRVITPDLPGYGKSSELPAGFSIKRTAALASQFMTRLGLASYFVGGVSLGGAITLEMVLTDRTAIKGVILLEPYFSSKCIIHPKFHKKLFLRLLSLVNRQQVIALINKTYYTHNTLFRFLNRIFAFPARVSEEDLHYKWRNLHACTVRTAVETVSELLKYVPPVNFTARQKALMIMDPHDGILDSQKTYTGFAQIFPRHQRLDVHLDSHNPKTLPTAEEMHQLLPTLLTDMANFFDIPKQ